LTLQLIATGYASYVGHTQLCSRDDSLTCCSFLVQQNLQHHSRSTAKTTPWAMRSDMSSTRSKYTTAAKPTSLAAPNMLYSPDVEFCGYSIPHPSEAKMNLRIQTYGQLIQHIRIYEQFS
jgi:hypothetical protein